MCDQTPLGGLSLVETLRASSGTAWIMWTATLPSWINRSKPRKALASSILLKQAPSPSGRTQTLKLKGSVRSRLTPGFASTYESVCPSRASARATGPSVHDGLPLPL